MSGQLTLTLCSVLLLVTISEAFIFGRMSTKGDGSGTYNGYSAPKYKILKKSSTYELRQYDPTNWVSTSAEGSSKGMFMKLFGYIGGANKAGKKISMTVPVAIKMEGADTAAKKFTMMFYLPADSNPEPTNSDVTLTSLPAQKFYVRQYGGYTSPDKVRYNLQALLAEIGSDADTSYFYSSGYDSPWRFWNRRNEVWVMAKN